MLSACVRDWFASAMLVLRRRWRDSLSHFAFGFLMLATTLLACSSSESPGEGTVTSAGARTDAGATSSGASGGGQSATGEAGKSGAAGNATGGVSAGGAGGATAGAGSSAAGSSAGLGGQAMGGQAGLSGSGGDNGADLFKLGVAGYTVREFSVDEALQWMQKWGLDMWAVKDVHLGLGSSQGAIDAFLAKAKAAQVHVYSAGVIYMYSQADVDKAFAYAQKLGIDHFTGVPNYDLLPAVENAVKATGIRIAIHNHGPDPEPYPTPDDIYSRIKNLDSRIGMCLDIGHAQRSKIDPSQALEMYADRIFDIHLKDVDRADASGKSVTFGTGVIDLKRFLATLRKVKYRGVCGIEFESDKATTETGMLKSANYFRDLMKTK